MIRFLGDVYLPEQIEFIPETDQPLVINLEYPITDYEKGYPDKVNVKANKNHLRETFGDGVLIANLANNHILDYREKGFRNTLQSLEKQDIYYFGAGYSKNNFNNPLIIEHDNKKIAFLGYAAESSSPVYGDGDSPGAARLDLERVKSDIEFANKQGMDSTIVSIHWGAQGCFLPMPEDQTRARKIIDLGADLIVGHHAHCIQPIERYNSKLICYGLGNSIFPDVEFRRDFDKRGEEFNASFKKQEWWNRESLALDVGIDGSIVFHKAWFNGINYRFEECDIDPREISGVVSSSSFRYQYFKSKFRKSLYSFCRNPKMIKPIHLKNLYKMIFPSRIK